MPLGLKGSKNQKEMINHCLKLLILCGFYTQNKLVCENFIFQFIEDEYNGDRIFCLDEDMSIIVFEK
jgi:hypothetical protein